MAINRNRELSQIASVVIVDDANKNVGIATTATPKVGIGKTDPSYKLDVVGAINSNNDVKVNGVSIQASALDDATALAIALGKNMANTFKLKTKANVGTATSDVYVVPSATTTVVIGVTLANTSGSSINVGVGVTRASSDDVKLMKNVPIPQGSSFEFMDGNKVVLETTDTLTVESDVNNSLDVALTIMEIT